MSDKGTKGEDSPVTPFFSPNPGDIVACASSFLTLSLTIGVCQSTLLKCFVLVDRLGDFGG